MNYTENYHLPQWDETDRILRKDFNSAMAQLEEGLTGNRDTAEDLRQSGGEMDEKNLKRLCRLTYNHYCAVTSMDTLPHQIGLFYQNASKDISNITGTMLVNNVRFAGKNGTGLTLEALAETFQEVTPLHIIKGNLPKSTPQTVTFTAPATGSMRRLYINGTYSNNVGENTTSFRITIKNLDTGSIEQTEEVTYTQKYTSAAFSEYCHGPFYFLGGAKYQITVQPLAAVCDMTCGLVLGGDSRVAAISNEGKVTAVHTLHEQEDSLGGMVILRCNISGAGGTLKLLWDGEERQPTVRRTAQLDGGRIAQELIYLRDNGIPADSTLSLSFECAEGGDFQFFDWGAVMF
ncbi:MAG: hypothetical protein HDT20_09375 [Oscillibacter sp.]|nr:hypothetical protein [Oscillibacter sp.]